MSDSQTNGPGADRDEEEVDPVEKFPYHRRFVRHEIRLKLDVQAERSYHAWTHNLSRDGLCFEIPAQLELGREITAWLFLENDAASNPVQVRCRVVWRDKGPKGSRHGGQFLFFAADGQMRLNAWLEDIE